MTSFHDDLLRPFSLDPTTGELYLQLEPPFSHIILTPPRLSDWPELVENLNDPVIYMNLNSPPYPFLESHARAWLARHVAITGELLDVLRAGPPGRVVDGCPVRVIRDISSATIAEAKAVGDCFIAPHGFEEVADFDERTRLCQENASKGVGDPTKTWSFGDWIDSAHRGYGIMTAVVGTIMREWAVPRMNVKHVATAAFVGNQASLRVFEKNGFKYVGDVEEVIQFPESKGGGRTGLHVLEWRRRDSLQDGSDMNWGSV